MKEERRVWRDIVPWERFLKLVKRNDAIAVNGPQEEFFVVLVRSEHLR